jgi:cell division protein FtsI (penicillin-binding protein 3)
MLRSKKNFQPRAVQRVGRLRLLFWSFAFFVLLLLLRLGQLQIIRGEHYTKLAKDQQTQKVAVASRRGRIVDRNAQELAVDLPQFYSVRVFPNQLRQGNYLCQELAALTNRPAWHYLKRLQSRTLPFYLEWRLTEEQKLRLESRGIAGIVLEQNTGRFYPYDYVTAQLLGYTDVDGRGISGLEMYCDSVLQGLKGWEMRSKSATGRTILDPFNQSISPKNGGTVRLSLDIVAQEVLYQELEAAICSTGSEWIGGLLMDPKSGEILSIVSLPSYDPLRPELSDPASHKLRPLTDLIEPGSVFKIVPASAGLDRDLVGLTDLFYCENGRYQIGPKVLRDAHPYGTLSFADVVVHSSNIGTAKIADRIGARDLYRYAMRFGFGSMTGVEFPGEASGFLRPYDQWREIGRANVAIGQGVSVTMLQVALAYSAIANDGILMEPRLILGWTTPQGDYFSNPPREVRRVLEPETARTMQQILAKVVKEGTGKAAAIDSMTEIAGKTGTAQIPNLESGGYYRDRYVASFIGFLPAYNARRVLIICAYNPKGAYYGAQVAAPIFRSVLQRLMPADMVRDSWREANPSFVSIPSYGHPGENDAEGATMISAASLTTPLLNIAKAAPTPRPRIITQTNQVPDVRGLTLRKAVNQMAQRGIHCEKTGSGQVVSQSLEPGSPIVPNSTCHLAASLGEESDSTRTDNLDSGQPPVGGQ